MWGRGRKGRKAGRQGGVRVWWVLQQNGHRSQGRVGRVGRRGQGRGRQVRRRAEERGRACILHSTGKVRMVGSGGNR